MEHSEAFQLFMKQKDSIDYALKREGYRDDLLQSIYPEERTEVETHLVSLLKQQDISVLKFMQHLTTFDGISIVAEQYEALQKHTMDTPNLAKYLYIHTKKRKYLEDILEYCCEDKCQYREEALKNLSELVPDLKINEIPMLYQISRTIILSENDSELLFWSKAIMRKCVKRLDIIGDDVTLRHLWEEVVEAIKDGNCEKRKEKLIAFDRNIKKDSFH
ncbi:hypothetical protein [Clostridium sp. Marseille-P299]|uniref:hypothetical protein n=1 Tax=Clostridium sp. Marseille-P299 TaxID=1805477 RepID=UPI00082CC9C3|nr:hypothetical protein [Clostridium sp. Marseille-P299]